MTTLLTMRLKAVGATWLAIALSFVAFRFGPHNAAELHATYGAPGLAFTGAQFLLTGTLLYAIAVTPYFLRLMEPQSCKALRSCEVLWRLVRNPGLTLASPLEREERVALLATLLKMFFAPLMLMQLLIFCDSALHNGTMLALGNTTSRGFLAAFNAYGFWMTIQVILFIDVLMFSAGYLVELPRLGNQIRSVDPSLRGWLVALLCYPPFNLLTGAVFGSAVTDFPRFDNANVHLAMNLLLLSLMAVYAASSVALGWKASNLTHRGIVARGPYAWVRHPAYTCKNLAWWIGSAPAVSTAFGDSLWLGLQALASVLALSLLYLLRALTEEDHLRGVDGDYASYAQQVHRRFIPGVI